MNIVRIFYMKIALIPMSAKPYHLGHHKLIQYAEKTNDAVMVFVSYSGRGIKKIKDPNDSRSIKEGAAKIEVPKKGEIPIFGDDMKYIWEEILLDELEFSDKVRLLTPSHGAHPSPIRNIHEVCEILLNQGVISVPFLDLELHSSEVSLSIYSDSNDILDNYDKANMIKMYGDLINQQIFLVGVDRCSTIDISGTQMRKFLKNGQIRNFEQFLPPIEKNSKNIVTKILLDSISSGSSFYCREQQKNIIDSYEIIPIMSG